MAGSLILDSCNKLLPSPRPGFQRNVSSRRTATSGWLCLFPSPPLPCVTLTSHPSSFFSTVQVKKITNTRRGKIKEARHCLHPLTHDTAGLWSEDKAYRKPGGTNLTEGLSLQGRARPSIIFPPLSLSQQQNTHVSVSFSTHQQNAQDGWRLPVYLLRERFSRV